jgi:hypothetical protein
MADHTIVPISSSATSTVIVSSHSFSMKLNTKNYLAWKTQFIPILNYQNLNGIVDGTDSPPPKTVSSNPNPEYDAWFKKDQMLLSWLFSSLTEEIFPYVIGLSPSQEVWTALANSFGLVSQNQQLQLHIELQELKRNDLSISQFL